MREMLKFILKIMFSSKSDPLSEFKLSLKTFFLGVFENCINSRPQQPYDHETKNIVVPN